MEMGSIRRVVESVRIHRNYKRAAKVASLQYVNDSMKGIRRKRKEMDLLSLWMAKNCRLINPSTN